jgi:hypothetical protein
VPLAEGVADGAADEELTVPEDDPADADGAVSEGVAAEVVEPAVPVAAVEASSWFRLAAVATAAPATPTTSTPATRASRRRPLLVISNPSLQYARRTEVQTLCTGCLAESDDRRQRAAAHLDS